jgi:hypothetical protein
MILMSALAEHPEMAPLTHLTLLGRGGTKTQDQLPAEQARPTPPHPPFADLISRVCRGARLLSRMNVPVSHNAMPKPTTNNRAPGNLLTQPATIISLRADNSVKP